MAYTYIIILLEVAMIKQTIGIVYIILFIYNPWTLFQKGLGQVSSTHKRELGWYQINHHQPVKMFRSLIIDLKTFWASYWPYLCKASQPYQMPQSTHSDPQWDLPAGHNPAAAIWGFHILGIIFRWDTYQNQVIKLSHFLPITSVHPWSMCIWSSKDYIYRDRYTR